MAETQLGEAQIPIRATTDKLDSDLAGARGKVQGALSKLAGGLQGVGKTVLGAGGVAIGVIAGIGAAIGKLAIDAAPVEGIQDAFDGLADSVGIGGDAMLDALQKGSAGMISQRDLMLSFNKAAGLVSTDFATKLPDAMEYLSKVAASTGQDMGFLMDSLVIGVGRVSPMILDNLGIQVSLADATARASEMFGVEAGALTKTQQQAGMMNVVLEKLAANTAAMPDVTESAAAKLAQLRAGFQDTKDTVGMAFVPALTILLELLANLAEKVLPPLVDFLEGTLGPAFERVAGVVSDFIWMLDVGVEPVNALKMALSTLFGPEIAETVMEIIASVQEFLTLAKEVLAPVAAWVSENVALQDVLLGLGIAVATVVVPALASIAGPVLIAIGAFLAVMAVVTLLRAAWESNFLGIQEIAASVWGWLQTFIPEALATIQETFNTVVAGIQTFWAEHGDAIMLKAQEIWDKVLAVFNWFKGQWALVYDAFRLAFEGNWEGFGATLREVWDEAWLQIQAIGETVWAAILKFFDDTEWGQVGEDVLKGIAKGIKSGVSFITNAIKGVIKAALGAVAGFFGGTPTIPAGGYPGATTFPQNALGTNYWRGGPTWVGEEGPELLNVPRGAQILSSLNSLSLVSGLARVSQQLADAGQWMEMVSRPRAAVAAGDGGQRVVIYGLTLEGVQDRAGLLAELQNLT